VVTGDAVILLRSRVPVTTMSPAVDAWSSCGAGAADVSGAGAGVSWANAGTANKADAPALHSISARKAAPPRSERETVELVIT